MRPSDLVVTTPDDIRRFAITGAAGESREYFRGFLAVEGGDRAHRVRPLYQKTAHEAREAASDMEAAGYVLLTQRRIGEGRWSYLMTVRRRVQARLAA